MKAKVHRVSNHSEKAMARKTKTDKFIIEYCQSHGIKLLVDPLLGKNDGVCWPDIKEIHLSTKYTSSSVKLVCFFHEVGHISVEKFTNKPYNTFECEFMSWTRAMNLHKKYFKKSFNKSQAAFMLKCLKTYCRSQYEFRKTPIEQED